MKRPAAFALVLAALAACAETSETSVAPTFASGGSASVVQVTTGDDTGPGSFRQAILDANADPAITGIAIASGIGAIALSQTITYTGAQSLRIDGGGAALDGSGLGADATTLLANGGGNLEIKDLTVRNAPGAGLIVAIPSSASGTIAVSLTGFNARDNGSHGVLINDQAEYFNDPNSTSSEGSAASLTVRVNRSSFENNGFTALDQDGLRINEGGSGVLDAVIEQTVVRGNGGDGVELDERVWGTPGLGSGTPRWTATAGSPRRTSMKAWTSTKRVTVP